MIGITIRQYDAGNETLLRFIRSSVASKSSEEIIEQLEKPLP